MIVWKPMKGIANAQEGFLAGYGLYVVCSDGKGTWLQGATLKAMSIPCKSVEAAMALAETNAAEVVAAFKAI